MPEKGVNFTFISYITVQLLYPGNRYSIIVTTALNNVRRGSCNEKVPVQYPIFDTPNSLH